MGNSGNKVNIDYDKTRKATSILDTALGTTINLKVNNIEPVNCEIDGIDNIDIDNNINDIINKYNNICEQIYDTIKLTRNDMAEVTKTFKNVDEEQNNISDSSTNLKSSIPVGGSLVSKLEQTSNKSKKTTKKKKKKKKKKTTKSMISDMLKRDALINTNALLNKITDIINRELKKIKKYLKKGDLVSAAKSYEFLKIFGQGKVAKSILTKNGYKVKKKDGEYVISKIKNDNPSNNKNNSNINNDKDVSTINDTNNTDTTDNDVVAEVKPNNEVTQDNNVEQNNTITNENNSASTKPAVNNSNSNNNYNGNQSSVQNTSTEVNNQGTTNQVETDTNTTVESKPAIESTKDKPKTNVVSITDDSETSSTKKSGGLGAAIPIGLGTIATGAAAVAGVRYVKNRHDNQEEYDENYDDENNNLDSDSEFVDAAQYDDGSTYMDDDYLGPVDNDLSEDSYVDPEDLEDIEDFSEDSVLEDLNSNY